MGLTFNASNLDSIKYNGTDLDVLKYNGTTVWERYNNLQGVILRNYAQISENNILSGFHITTSDDDDIISDAITDKAEQYFNNSQVMELDLKFTLNYDISVSNWAQCLISFVTSMISQNQYLTGGIEIGKYNNDSNLYIRLINLVETGTISIQYNFIQGGTYWLKFINSPQVKVYISTDGINYTDIYTYASPQLRSLCENSPFSFGNRISRTYYGEFVTSQYTFEGTIDLNECFIKSNDEVIWKIGSKLQRYDKALYYKTPILLHMDSNVTNSGTAQLNWTGEGFFGSSTGGKFNGYNMYAGWYDFSGLNYSVSDNYTIEMWMKTIEYTDNYNSFTWGKGSSPTRIFTIELNNKPSDKSLVLRYSNGAYSVFGLGSLDTWTHIAITYTGGTSMGKFTLFLNGIKKTTWNDDGSTSGYNTVFNGNEDLKNLGYSGWDEVVVHNYVRYTKNFVLQTEPYTI